MNDLIKKYRVMPEAVCDALTDWFEASPSFHVQRDDDFKRFTEINVNDKEPDLVPTLTNFVLLAHERYVEDHPEYRRYLRVRALEEFRVKRYRENRDEFKTHVDVGDVESSKRKLAFLFYLNDEFEGGQTAFGDTLITPVKGDILIFPPMWMFPHAGMPVTRGTKYIMSSYLHYN